MNKSRILALSGGILAILLLVIGGTWFWSVGSVAAEKLPSIRVQVVNGSVEYKSGDVWSVIQDVQEVHAGDMVKTGADSEAQILWGDQGITRIDQNTELVIEEAPVDGSAASSIIRLQINAGRVWNRMLKLLDVDSAMEVRTSDVVATVRGTSYGIIKQPSCTEAAVTESAVSIASAGTETLLTDDQWGSFGANDCKKPVRKLTPEDAWPAEQKAKDMQFDRDVAQAWRERLDGRVSSAPAWIRETSENLHLALAGNKEELALGYARRALADSSLDRVRALLPIAGDKASIVRSELHNLISLKVDPTKRGELVLLRDAIMVDTETDQRFRELVRIDEGVDDVLENAVPVDQRTQVVADLMTRLDAIDAALGEDGDTRVKAKSEAVRARLSIALGIPDMTVPVEPDPSDKPDIRINEPSLRNPVIKPAPTEETGRVYLNLSLLPSNSSPVSGQIVTYKLFGVKADGQSVDITAQAALSLARPSDGYLQGTVLTPVYIGNIVVNATYRDSVGSRTVSATITHSTPKVIPVTGLQSIELRFTGPTTVTCSTSLPYKVYAIYDGGASKDVTISSRMTVSDSKLLFPGDAKILTFCSGQQATASATASYTEQGVTKTATVDITVIPDASTPSRGSRYPYMIY